MRIIQNDEDSINFIRFIRDLFPFLAPRFKIKKNNIYVHVTITTEIYFKTLKRNDSLMRKYEKHEKIIIALISGNFISTDMRQGP